MLLPSPKLLGCRRSASHSWSPRRCFNCPVACCPARHIGTPPTPLPTRPSSSGTLCHLPASGEGGGAACPPAPLPMEPPPARLVPPPPALQVCEERGCFAGADPAQVSDRAKKRGVVQLGSLGSGNHYTEIQVGRCTAAGPHPLLVPPQLRAPHGAGWRLTKPRWQHAPLPEDTPAAPPRPPRRAPAVRWWTRFTTRRPRR